MKKKYWFEWLWLCLALLLIVVPVILMIVWIFTERWAWPSLVPQVFSARAVNEVLRRRGELFQLAFSSMVISLTVAFFSAVISLLTARALVFYEFPGKQFFYFMTIFPLMIPALVLAMGIQLVFIRLGLNNTVAGVILVHLITSLPYAVRLVMDGTEALGMRLEEQARVLGASVWQAFFRTTLPALAPVLLSAFCMAYIVSFSQYFLTLLIGGGRVKTFTVVMVPYLQSGNRNIACVYSVLFLGITFVLFGILEKLAGHWTKQNSGGFYES